MKARRVLAIARKEMLLRLRFKCGYFFETISTPMRLAVLFLFIYGGFFSSGASNIGSVNEGNYIVFILLGMALSDILNTGFNLMARSFLWEKFWQTIHGFLISPATKIELICGIGIGGLVDSLPLLVVSMALSFFLMPISTANFLCVVVIILFAYMMILGFSFINAAFVLSNENFSAVFNFAALVMIFMSCFYYPIESLPRFLQPLAQINPVYHANIFIKSLWIFGVFEAKSLVYVFVMSVLSLFFGVYVFDRVLSRMGIQGY